MELDDLKQSWKQTIDTPSNEEEIKAVIAKLEQEMSKIDKEIKRRDYLEISIALLLIPAWIFGLFTSAGLMQTVGFIIAIIACLYIPYKLIKAKQVSAQKTDSNIDFLNTEKQKVEQQKNLLESIIWWYLAPLTTAIVMITLGATVDASGMPEMTTQLSIYYGFVGLLMIAVYFLNKRAAKKKFTPLLNKIEQRLAELQN